MLLAGAALGLFAASCTPGQAMLGRQAHNAREDLVGMSRDELLHCAGQPVGDQQQGSWEYLSYISSPPPPTSDHSRCVTTFRLRGGYVESVNYETPNGRLIGQSIAQCLETVGPCVANLH
jgi:hypothetical protein